MQVNAIIIIFPITYVFVYFENTLLFVYCQDVCLINFVLCYNICMFNWFAKKSGLGIEITTKYIRFVEITENKNLLTLARFGRVKIPISVFEESRSDELVSLVQPILDASRTRRVRLVLPDESIRFFSVLVPHVSSKELKEQVVLGLKENLSYHEYDDEILDMHVIAKENGVLTVRVAVIAKKSQAMFAPLLASMKKYDVHIERASQAALVGSSGDTERPRVHIQFGDDFCSISGVFDGAVRMYQEIPFSTYRFLAEVQKRLTQPSHTASSYLSHLGIYGADVTDFSQQAFKAFGVVLDHALSDFGLRFNVRIETITLGGMCAGYRGVDQMIGSMARVPVTLSYPWHPLDSRFDDSIYSMKKQETLEYLAALGLAVSCID